MASLFCESASWLRLRTRWPLSSAIARIDDPLRSQETMSEDGVPIGREYGRALFVCGCALALNLSAGLLPTITASLIRSRTSRQPAAAC
jgi:ABC-type lipoprotein release transport system permease subunit